MLPIFGWAKPLSQQREPELDGLLHGLHPPTSLLHPWDPLVPQVRRVYFYLIQVLDIVCCSLCHVFNELILMTLTPFHWIQESSRGQSVEVRYLQIVRENVVAKTSKKIVSAGTNEHELTARFNKLHTLMLRRGALSSNSLPYILTMLKLFQMQVWCLPLDTCRLWVHCSTYPVSLPEMEISGVQRVEKSGTRYNWWLWVQSFCPFVCQQRDWSVWAPWFIKTSSTLSQLTHMLVSNDSDHDDDNVMTSKMVIGHLAYQLVCQCSTVCPVTWQAYRPHYSFLKKWTFNDIVFKPVQHLNVALFDLQWYKYCSPCASSSSCLVQNIERSHKTKPVVQLLSLVHRKAVAPSCDWRLWNWTAQLNGFRLFFRNKKCMHYTKFTFGEALIFMTE